MKRRDRVHDDAGEEAVLATKRHKNTELVGLRACATTSRLAVVFPRQLELLLFVDFLSTRSLLKTPVLQLPIAAAGGQRAGFGALDLDHSVRLRVYLDLHAGAAVTVMYVGFDPLLWAKFGPVAFGLMATLDADDPFGVAIV